MDSIFSRPIAYDNTDVVELRSMRWLNVRLGGEGFLLPLVNVGSEVDPVAIAWFDPHPSRNPALCKAAARSMAGQLREIHPRLIVTPPSTKSGPFIEAAATLLHRLPPVKVITLIGGDDETSVSEQSVVSPVTYVPVTRLASGKPKFLGMDEAMVRDIRALSPDGNGMVLVDDIETTGSTIQAMAELLNITNYEVAVIAKESELEDGGYPPTLLPNRHVVFYLPEIKGLHGKLYPLEPKSDIPSAIRVR